MLAVVALLALHTVRAQEGGDAYDYDGDYDLDEEDRIPPPEEVRAHAPRTPAPLR